MVVFRSNDLRITQVYMNVQNGFKFRLKLRTITYTKHSTPETKLIVADSPKFWPQECLFYIHLVLTCRFHVEDVGDNPIDDHGHPCMTFKLTHIIPIDRKKNILKTTIKQEKLLLLYPSTQSLFDIQAKPALKSQKRTTVQMNTDGNTTLGVIFIIVS